MVFFFVFLFLTLLVNCKGDRIAPGLNFGNCSSGIVLDFMAVFLSKKKNRPTKKNTGHRKKSHLPQNDMNTAKNTVLLLSKM